MIIRFGLLLQALNLAIYTRNARKSGTFPNRSSDQILNCTEWDFRATDTAGESNFRRNIWDNRYRNGEWLNDFEMSPERNKDNYRGDRENCERVKLSLWTWRISSTFNRLGTRSMSISWFIEQTQKSPIRNLIFPDAKTQIARKPASILHIDSLGPTARVCALNSESENLSLIGLVWIGYSIFEWNLNVSETRSDSQILFSESGIQYLNEIEWVATVSTV
jgi:hypothetical protein